MFKRFPGCVFVALVSCAACVLSGCALQSTAPAAAQSGSAIRGNLHGGQQPVVGAHVYLFAAGTTGYGGKGIPAGDGTGGSTDNRSISLLTSAVTTNNPGRSGHDSNGYYVTSGDDGGFTITNDYSCAFGQQLYLYAVGGNPGAGTNPAAGLMAAIGECGILTPSSNIWVNEVSTVAAAYALAGFSSDATHISSPSTTLAIYGIANAFRNAANIVGLSTGVAVQTSGNLVAPYRQVNSLANILASCVNSTGKTSSSCSALFAAATSTGDSGGTTAGDTAAAAIYIAQHPSANVHTLWIITPPAVAFGPTLSVEPADWAVALTFSGGGLNFPAVIAIDISGNPWVSNSNGSSISGFTSQGVDSSSGSGFLDPATPNPAALAIDPFGFIWAGSASTPAHLAKWSGVGMLISGHTVLPQLTAIERLAFTSSGTLWISSANVGVGKLTDSSTAFLYSGAPSTFDIGFDASGSLWGANNAGGPLKFDASGNAILVGSGGGRGQGLAIDNAGNVWTAGSQSSTAGSLYKYNSSGFLVVSAVGGGLYQPSGIAIDGAGHVFVANGSSTTLGGISEFDSSGTALTGSVGYKGGLSIVQGNVAIDGSGDVWTFGDNTLIELVGLATPVVTPVVANLNPPYGKPASKP